MIQTIWILYSTLKTSVEYKFITHSIVQILFHIYCQVELLKNRIPYHVTGALAFGHRREVRDALSYLVLLNNPRNRVALERCINTPPRKIGDRTQKALFKWIDDEIVRFEQEQKKRHRKDWHGGYRLDVAPTLSDFLLAIRLLDTSESSSIRDKYPHLSNLLDESNKHMGHLANNNSKQESDDDSTRSKKMQSDGATNDRIVEGEGSMEKHDTDSSSDKDNQMNITENNFVSDSDSDSDSDLYGEFQKDIGSEVDESMTSLHLDTALHEELSRNCPLNSKELQKLFPFVQLYWLLMNIAFAHSKPPPLSVVLSALMADIGKFAYKSRTASH